MKKFFGLKTAAGFTLLEIVVGTAIFMLFALGVYSSINLVFRIVYSSRVRILETAVLSEQLELVRNLPFDKVGIVGGIPSGVIPYFQTTTRSGITFDIITTVRNIDDPFDGMATGTPMVDTSPADYKLVEISAICQTCNQSHPVILNTIVAPKGLEGASDNGSLFIHVFDSNGLDVSGASVTVTNSTTDPVLVINDTTDNEGMVRIIDTPTGTLAYNIVVTSAGYSTDYTVVTSTQNPSPTKLPANVASQTVTDISFAIDQVGSLNITTMNESCTPLGSIPFRIHGDKTIGLIPIIYKYDKNLTSDSGGLSNLTSMEWDNYNFSTSGTAHDIAGLIPAIPVKLAAGQTQNVSMLLRSHTSNSMLVLVRDASTLLPLAEASVRLTKGSYDETILTGVGFLRQTDWAGGSGQVSYVNSDEYFSDNNNVDTSPPGDLTIKKVAGQYSGQGVLESSTFDFGSSTINYANLIWEPLAQPTSTSVRFQIAATNSSTPAQWDFLGPDGASTTYYTSTTTLIYSGHDNKRYFRYKVFLDTSDSLKTPLLSELSITYTNQCSPPGQSFFGGLTSGSYTLEVSKSGYQTVSTVDTVDGNAQAIVDLSPS